ncbi:MAG: cobalamin biosynthesis protein CbiM [bacterium (Candidatus Ratteibacteria) CG23_combo_of_CG06-09_8_20_14_all_48_7]|uniref:Cobalamin biosynthesis protein CbiM n=1 Tax=bacterium (Candidatus Ratteibacteria) CG23_combo_of_CG06-09_8_20_14_all_48_7 TaxID=2014292 RepID=A0A2G9YA59_9BACT|nr:MAG: cobalamin biosynthesis protein CbiM [bacterium (Candidatus Ratteibacteria) CG23_combo_of_CG06-09_8_20_14_all_48_7]
MHISEGVLSAPVLITGALLSAGGVGLGLKKISYEKMPKVAVLSSAFFVASLIHVPIGPSSVHLVLNGLLGILLGLAAFPSILVALTLQALLFQFGGFTSLGVNTFNMAAPAVISYYLFNFPIRKANHSISMLAGFGAGMTGVGLGALFVAIALITTGESFLNIAKIVVVAHLPVMVIEGIITSFCVIFLKRVKPEILEVKR